MEIPIVNRDELRNLVDKKGNYVLVDVRELEELKHGMIPTAKNLPMSELLEAFDLPEEGFKAKYGFDKPKKENNIIFYCRTGERSRVATQLAIQKGFKKARNYFGSVYDWSDFDSNVKKY